MYFKLNWLFGITIIPFEKIELPFVFGNEPPFVISIKNKDKNTTKFKVGFKSYGKSQEEKQIIRKHFMPEYELEKIPATMSLEITFQHKFISKNFDQNSIENMLINYLPNIKIAVERFYDAYRKLIFIKQIDSKCTFEEVSATLKRNLPLSFKELRDLLLYDASFRKKSVQGVISEGKGASFSNLQKPELETFRNFLKKGQTLPESWLFSAFVSYHEERYDETVISSAIALESALSRWIEKKLKNKQITLSEIEKLINNASKRDVLLIVYKTLNGKITETQKTDIIEVFNLRNSLVHGRGKFKGREKANKALATSLDFLKNLDYFKN
ncbi:MAG: hypothetical protein WC220_05555 [Pedobacter sp.]|jgi:hypothetical protein